MSLKQVLQDNMKSAMKAREELRVSTIRLALSAVRNAEIDKRRELSDEEISEVLSKEAKQRREAIEGAEKAGRVEFAERERGELAVLNEFLPEQLGEDDIERIAKEVIESVGASGIKDRGRVMSALMPRIRGKADGKVAGQVVERILQG